MDIVTDTSILLAVVLNEPEKRAIIESTAGLDLIGPPVIPWEVGNAFTAMFRRNKISLRDALKAYKAFQEIPIRYVGVDIEEALQVASDLGIYAYDAYFLVCGNIAKAPLVSLDRALASKAKEYGLRILEV